MTEEWLFHIMATLDWERVRGGSLYTPATFEQDGFIHLCMKDQIAGVIEQYYREAVNLIALCIEPKRLQAELRYENLLGGDELFPHLYGPLNLDAVLEAVPV
jgi:uncharacterized protein (DUF952 family)